jgi:hypothetical protein
VIAVSVEVAGMVLVNAVIVGVGWGAMRRDVSGTRRDIHDIKKALALEPVNGKIESAFIPRLECQLREEGVGKRLEACEGKLGDHEHRINAVEAGWGRDPNRPRSEPTLQPNALTTGPTQRAARP